jgi:predicted ATPase
LRTSVDHGLIFFDFEQAMWNWDEERISKLEVSEDIVEYLIQNTLQDIINQDTVEVLQLAACLGNREFNTFILSNGMGLPPEEVRPTPFYFLI